MSRSSLVIGITNKASMQQIDRLRRELESKVPHVAVLLVWGASGMVLVPPEEAEGETATAPAGAGSVTIQISGDADPAEVGRRITEYLDAHHRNTMRSRS